MHQIEQLKYGNFYHIYNHGVGNRDLFLEADNYEYFLSQWDKYISPVADMYAWVLMKNHFHVLVRIKNESEIVEAFTPDRVRNPVRGDVPRFNFQSSLIHMHKLSINAIIVTERCLSGRLIANTLIMIITLGRSFFTYITIRFIMGFVRIRLNTHGAVI